MVTRGKKYSPDLRSFMAICAANYAKLLKLLPEIKSYQKDHETIRFIIKDQPDLRITLLQSSAHTQTFNFKQIDPDQHLNRDFCLRVYHDAQLVEVISGVHDSMLPPVYKIPNPEMKQVDEKAQLNRFLGEWLSFCLEYAKIDTQIKTHLVFLS